MTDKTMRERVEHMEQLAISAMTCDGEYQVENAGEHATQIVKVLLADKVVGVPLSELIEKAERELSRYASTICGYIVVTVGPWICLECNAGESQ